MAKVFISYSTRDYIGDDGKVIPGNVVDKVCKALSDSGITYWIDREGLDPGVTYAEIIASKIKECDTFLFLSSRSANESAWTLREISTAIDFGKTVLPVKLDASRFADSVALYLASVQYIDWNEMGETEALRRIVGRINAANLTERRHFRNTTLPTVTSFAVYAGLFFLAGVYAYLSYLFLWAETLKSGAIIGGLAGYVCEFGILMSVYYLIRIVRMRRSVFIIPALLVVMMLLAGLLIRDSQIVAGAGLLMLGWLFILTFCLIGKQNGKNFFALMNKEESLFRLSDVENVILVYLFIKAFILVLAHYLDPFSLNHSFITPFL